jgi:DNA-binding response OmpR family regulator
VLVDSVHSLAYLLNDMGHAVEYAINGYVALDVARRFRPHFVLLDLGLPDIDGFEVCRRLKRDPDLESCRVVASPRFLSRNTATALRRLAASSILGSIMCRRPVCG